MYLYLDDISPNGGTDAPEFLIKASAALLKQNGGRNWIPVIVKQTSEDKYEVIGNSFVYTVAEQASLERVWCIIADNSDETVEITKVLAGEKMPKINLSKASRDEIMAGLQYLIEQPGSALKTVKIAVAVNRIDEAPRQSWQNFEPIIKLKCGITKGAKLDALKQVFYITPPTTPDKNINSDLLKPKKEKEANASIYQKMSLTALKKIAKEKGITGYSKMNKNELIAAIEKISN